MNKNRAAIKLPEKIFPAVFNRDLNPCDLMIKNLFVGVSAQSGTLFDAFVSIASVCSDR